MQKVTSTNFDDLQKPGIALVRTVGYGLLLLSLVDYASIFFPVKLMDPVWEIQTVQDLIGQVAAPLLGIVMVFHRQLEFRSKKEAFLIKQISWAALVVGQLYFLLIPILVVSNIHLDNQLNQQVVAQIDQRTEVINRVEQQLDKANSKQALQALVSRLSGQPLPPELQQKTAAELKSTLSQQLSKAKPTIRPQIESIAQNSRLSLLKKTVKLLMGALICGTLFVYIWHLTKWARRIKSARKKLSQQ